MLFFLLFVAIIVVTLGWVLSGCIMFLGLKQMFIDHNWAAWKGVVIFLIITVLFLLISRVLYQQMDKYTDSRLPQRQIIEVVKIYDLFYLTMLDNIDNIF